MSAVKVLLEFVPLVNFDDADLRSSYVAGLSYSVREGNDLLAEKVSQWVDEKRVRIVTNRRPVGEAVVQGTGKVS